MGSTLGFKGNEKQVNFVESTAASQGKTKAAVLKEALNEYMAKQGDPEPGREPGQDPDLDPDHPKSYDPGGRSEPGQEPDPADPPNKQESNQDKNPWWKTAAAVVLAALIGSVAGGGFNGGK